MHLVTLDTNYLRGAPIAVLLELKTRGFRLCTTALTLQEFWAQTMRENERAMFDGRIAALRKLALLDAEFPILAAGDVLMRCLYEEKPNVWNEAAETGRRHWARWSRADSMSAADWSYHAIVANDDINEKAEHHEMSYRKARIDIASSPTAETIGASEFFDLLFKDYTAMHPPHVSQRLDAFLRLDAMRGAHYACAEQPRKVEHNDVEDHANLMQLARPVIVATDDVRLVEDVDATGTPQAQWIRRIADLFEDTLPSVPPWEQHSAALFVRRDQRAAHQLHQRVVADCKAKHPRPAKNES